MSQVDRIARDVFALIAAGYMPVLGMLLYDEIGRLDRAPAAKDVRSSIPGAA